jgi:hypothetical protein
VGKSYVPHLLQADLAHVLVAKEYTRAIVTQQQLQAQLCTAGFANNANTKEYTRAEATQQHMQACRLACRSKRSLCAGRLAEEATA